MNTDHYELTEQFYNHSMLRLVLESGAAHVEHNTWVRKGRGGVLGHDRYKVVVDPSHFTSKNAAIHVIRIIDREIFTKTPYFLTTPGREYVYENLSSQIDKLPDGAEKESKRRRVDAVIGQLEAQFEATEAHKYDDGIPSFEISHPELQCGKLDSHPLGGPGKILEIALETPGVVPHGFFREFVSPKIKILARGHMGEILQQYVIGRGENKTERANLKKGLIQDVPEILGMLGIADADKGAPKPQARNRQLF